MRKICGNCLYIYRHQYNSSMKYCEKRKQKNTAYGNLKVKSRDKACELFQEYDSVEP